MVFKIEIKLFSVNIKDTNLCIKKEKVKKENNLFSQSLNFSGDGFRGLSISESVFGSSGDVFHVAHSSGSFSSSCSDFFSPSVISSHLGSREAATGTPLLLVVVSCFPASTALTVGFLVLQTKCCCSFRFHLTILFSLPFLNLLIKIFIII